MKKYYYSTEVLIAMREGSNNPLWLLGDHLGSTSSMKNYYYAGSTRVAMRTGSSTLNYLLGDHLGSTVITASSSGAKSAEIRYYPWGKERYTYSTTPTTYHFTSETMQTLQGGQRLESMIVLLWGKMVGGKNTRHR